MYKRLQVIMRGTVQGVGFRPWLYRLSKERNLHGTIANNDQGVIADLEGKTNQLQDLLQSIPRCLPPHAQIDEMSHEWLPVLGRTELVILQSEDAGGRGARIPSDLATCNECLAEIKNSEDRRHAYAFTNCTACGPRFTIVEAIPYDRLQTSMRSFVLCPACAAEYQDPLNRRYHAEPTACPQCGPTLQLVDQNGSVLADDPIQGAVERLGQGQVIAIKGLGGFHLAVDPFQEEAVERLRRRKGREQKPLAIMVRDMAEAHRQAIISENEARVLQSSSAPIVLLGRRADSRLHPSIAPGNPYVGLMLPYTPLHHLLFQQIDALVMTSGNLTEEPIAIQNEEARHRLAGLADAFLEHNRNILVACDDSVMRCTGRGALLIRRSRGFVPDPIRLHVDAGQVLATGGQLKNTFCLTLGHEAYLGPHVGDLDNWESYEHFQRAVDHMQRLLRIKPEAVVHDLHPDYVTTQYAESLGLPTFAVQHHHAHLAATAIDHELTGPVLGVALDGTGYGTDHSIWGGELLFLPDLGRFERVAHLKPFLLPGGDACIRAPRRTALSVVQEYLGAPAVEQAIAFLDVPETEANAVKQMVQRRVGTIPTTSCGRLFDAVAALCGLGQRVTYEGQPAMELEFLAARYINHININTNHKIDNKIGIEVDINQIEPYPFALELVGGEVLVIDPSLALDQILDELSQGKERGLIAAKFHLGLVDGWARACDQVARARDVQGVVLGGGCFQNQLLLEYFVRKLEQQGLVAYLPRRIPVNDGGIALGQAAVFAAQRLRPKD